MTTQASSAATDLLQKGDALKEAGKYEEAISCYDEAIELNPTDSDVFYNKGLCLYQLKKYEDAIPCFDEAFNLKPKHSEAVTNKGMCHSALCKYELAISCYDKSIRINSKNPQAYLNKGNTLKILGKYEESASCYDKVIRFNPHDITAYYNKGKMYQHSHKDEMALECFIQAYDAVRKEANKAKIEERGGLIEKLKDLQKTIADVARVCDTLDQNNERDAWLLKAFKKLMQNKDKLAKDMVDNLEKVFRPNDDSIINAVAIANNPGLRAQFIEMPKIIDNFKLEMEDFKKEFGKRENDQEKAGIKKEFSNLKELDPRLYIYCKTFYWTAINLFGGYRSLSAGLTQDNIKSVSAQEDLLAQGAQQLAIHAVKIAKGTSFSGSLIRTLDSIINHMFACYHKKNKITAVKKLIQSEFGKEDDISISIAQVALAVAKKRNVAICNPDLLPPPKSTTVKGNLWLKNKIEAIKSQIVPLVIDAADQHDMNDHSVTLALSDVTVLMALLFQKFEDITGTVDPLYVQCVGMIANGGLEQMLAAMGTSKSNSQKKKQEIPEIPEIAMEGKNEAKCAVCQSCNMF